MKASKCVRVRLVAQLQPMDLQRGEGRESSVTTVKIQIQIQIKIKKWPRGKPSYSTRNLPDQAEDKYALKVQPHATCIVLCVGGSIQTGSLCGETGDIKIEHPLKFIPRFRFKIHTALQIQILIDI